MTEAIVDDALETLPIRAAQRIVQHIHEQLGIEHVTVDKVFTILERVLGEEFIAKNAQVRETARKLDINNRMDFEYSDKPEPLVLTNLAQQKLETPKEIHGEKSTDQILEDYIRDLVTKESKQSGKSKRFDKSRREYSNRLRSQHQLLQMFPDSSRQGKKLDANDHEMDSVIRLTYDDEKPSTKDIEKYRGERDEELTDADRALLQAENYMSKVIEYFRHVQGIQNLKQIPSRAERAMILENFHKYLVDARYYIKFYKQYSHYWAPQATMSIEPYKGLYVPIERRKEDETYHYGQPISEFVPLREMVYQDFHDRVRNGLPPSLDFRNLPQLAMFYARTTFAPAMTKEEMDKVFYPPIRPIGDPVVQVPKYKPKPGKRKDRHLLLNGFQREYLTRKNLNKKQYYSYFDPATERYHTIGGEELLIGVQKLMYAIGTPTTETQFPQHDHCVWLLHSLDPKIQKTCTLAYIQLMCASLLFGIPFVTVPEGSTPRSLENLVGYCRVPLTCTYDRTIVTTLSKATTKSLKESLSMQTLLYYGNSEPYQFIDEIGVFCKEDPVSTILQPTPKQKRKDQKNALWEYMPENDLVLEYKSMMANTKGVGGSQLEKHHHNVLERCIQWREIGMENAIMYVSGDTVPRVMEYFNFEAICESLHEQLLPMLRDMKNTGIQVLIAIPISHTMFHTLICFCIRFSYSFATVSNEQLSRHVAYYKPSVVIANTSDILQLLHDDRVQEFKSSGNILERDQITDIHIAYEGLLGDEGRLQSRLVQNIRSLVRPKEQLHGVISLGHVPPNQEYQVKHFYHISHSGDLLGPLECHNVKDDFKPLKIWGHIRTVSDHVEVDGTFAPKTCVKSVLANENQDSFNIDEIYDENKFDMPEEVINSLRRLKVLQAERIFYEQVLAVLQDRAKTQSSGEDSHAPTEIEQQLYNALLDELDTVVPQERFDQLVYDDIHRYIILRIELTQESERLQDIDYKFRFVNANKEGHVHHKTKQERRGPQVDSTSERFIVRDYHGWVPKKALVMCDDELIDVYLLQYLFISNLITRCCIQVHGPYLTAIVFTKDGKQVQNTWREICRRVAVEYEKHIGYVGRTPRKQSYLSFLSSRKESTTAPVQVAGKFYLPFWSNVLVTNDAVLPVLLDQNGEFTDNVTRMFGSVISVKTGMTSKL